MITIPISIGEFYDRYTILLLKSRLITDKNKLVNINKELDYYTKLKLDHPIASEYVDNLLIVNQKIWQAEEILRQNHFNCTYNEEFDKAALTAFTYNDVRLKIKKQINIKYQSDITEEKSYNYL
jgi:hypothetical protein